jgi:hypothetical protein
MPEWLDKARSKQQKLEDKKIAEAKKISKNINALKSAAIDFINNSGIYDIIAQYFTDLEDIATANEVHEAKTAQYIPHASLYYDHNLLRERNLQYIDIKKEIQSDPTCGLIIHPCGSGDEFQSKIRTKYGKEICNVSIAVFLTYNPELTFFVPIILIAFSKSSGYEDKDTFINTDPDKDTLFAWLKEKTTLYLEKISPKD